jgi:hypothetical protein
MAYSSGPRRYRGSKKRISQIRFTAKDRWLAVLIVLLTILAMAVGAWLGFNYED